MPCSRIYHTLIFDLVQAYHVFFQCSQEPPEPQPSKGFLICYDWISCAPQKAPKLGIVFTPAIALQDTGQLIGTSRSIWTENVPCSILVLSPTFATGEYVNMFHGDMMILPVSSF